MAKMTVKEHDVINFSIKVKVGARRCYEKEIFQIGDVLFVLVDGRCVPLSDVYHIEKIGRNLNCKNEITYTTEIKQLTKERDELKTRIEFEKEWGDIKVAQALADFKIWKQQTVKDTAKDIYDELKNEVISVDIPRGGEPSEENCEAVLWWKIEEILRKKCGNCLEVQKEVAR